jgi:hypothetical protein
VGARQKKQYEDHPDGRIIVRGKPGTSPKNTMKGKWWPDEGFPKKRVYWFSNYDPDADRIFWPDTIGRHKGLWNNLDSWDLKTGRWMHRVARGAGRNFLPGRHPERDKTFVSGELPTELPIELPRLPGDLSTDDLENLTDIDIGEIEDIVKEIYAVTSFEIGDVVDMITPILGDVLGGYAEQLAEALNHPALGAMMKVKNIISQMNAPRVKTKTIPPYVEPLEYYWMKPKYRARHLAASLAALQMLAAAKGWSLDEGTGYKKLIKILDRWRPKVTFEQAQEIQRVFADDIRKNFRNAHDASALGKYKFQRGLPLLYPVKYGTGQPPAAAPVAKAAWREPTLSTSPRIFSRFTPARPVDIKRVTTEPKTEKPKKKRKVKKDMPKRKKTASRKVNVPHVEAEAIERRKLRVLSRIYHLFRKGQGKRARRLAAKLARV